jgi:hypothetical protein
MFLWLAGILVLIWIVSFVLFHIAAFGIHILVLLAVVAIVFHFLRGSR